MRASAKENLSDIAYEQIKDMILHLDVKPGEKIPEERIVKFVAGSRTPVREALRRLSSEGLVRFYPRRFSQVAFYDDEAVCEIGLLRLSLDCLAANLAVTKITDEDIKKLEQLALRCQMGVESGNVYDRVYYDTCFHLYIAEISKNRFLIQEQKRSTSLCIC